MLIVGERAPLFSAINQNGDHFDLITRKEKGFTVLYFYPKAGTPGCTKQACAFRDAIQKIRSQQAEVYGISADSVADLKKFHTKQNLTFDLLADPDGRVIELFGAKAPLLNMARRWTFILDSELNIRWIERDVDPLLDAQRVADQIKLLREKKDSAKIEKSDPSHISATQGKS
ncbi:MAG: peroxiredoxin [Oligoflexales bacterium]|nr:peroxiredoxin [Oligoflexales bacterium]